MARGLWIFYTGNAVVPQTMVYGNCMESVHDEVLAELWEAKNQLAMESGYDVASLLARLRDAQFASPRLRVNLAREKREAETTDSPSGVSHRP